MTAPTTPPKHDPIPCAAGCKRTVADLDEAEQSGWSCLPITTRLRCPQCESELFAVRGIAGVEPDPQNPDPLPPTSRGALPKATADSIALPSVRP